jgi:hypothetical protein
MEKQRNEPPSKWIEYAGSGLSERSKKNSDAAVAFGAVSFALMVFQIPWAIAVVCWQLSNHNLPPQPRSLYEMIAGILHIFWPTPLGMILGVYSVTVAGMTKRNALGVVGLLMGAAVVIFIVFTAYFG